MNGTYVGIIDLFERRIELDGGSKTLAEVVPGDNTQPLNFFLCDEFFTDPPDFADVYLMGGDALVYIKRFGRKDGAVKVVRQSRFAGNLITLFSQGGMQLSCEGESFELYDLDDAFAQPTQFSEGQVGGYPVFIIAAKGCLCVISERGKRVFYNSAESFTCGDMLEITVNFHTCAGAVAKCSFGYDGENMTLSDSKTEEQFPPAAEVAHFAFFESVLTRGDYAKYLGDGLKDKAALLPEYLGEFIDVTVPPSKFYAEHGDCTAAGLVYARGKNVFEVKYYAVEMSGGKIENIMEI